ncbi:6,7-dimethyl-8-ribityllumazine synthase [Candidatus Haliotispira prima]|uniref:6,7-dimethyl-8-ribityllumazine synthase n=1 Tax=Candidatus Haliotispira prima TaxID=3034016 RepID=A0ABY8MMQ5_9SPIO|nr:6,7-dimethyl-8-ribityllumazine synthase [Candidatus Haliotispira prima]
MSQNYKVIEGTFEAKGLRCAIVCARFNEFIVSKLLGGAIDCLVRHGIQEADQSVYWVPGAMELPLIAGKLAEKSEIDVVICLGAVIRGGTPHFDMVSGEATKGIAQASLQSGKPVIFGVLTTDSIEQAVERAGTKMGNKGWEAALNAIEMHNLCQQL